MSAHRGDEGALAATRTEFRVLGPVGASRDGVELELGPRKQRAVLAVLLLNENRVVPTERLIDELWGDAPPETARAALQVYIAGLRKALGDAGLALTTRSPGYVLAVEDGALDVDRFTRLRDEARGETDMRRRSALLHDALALWRGESLAELDGEPFAAAARPRLEELRLGALEERIDADLALGYHAELVGELDGLVRENPYRERLRGQQMLALYRSGRQADALAAFRAARAVSVDDLGLEPGPELRALERAMLDHDPALAPPRPPSRAAAEPAGRPRRRLLLAGAIVFAALVAGVAIVLLLTRQESSSVVVAPNSVAVIDPATDDVVTQVPVGLRPGPIAAERGFVWVGNLEDRTLTRIDVARRTMVGNFPLGGRTPTGLAVDRGVVWVGHGRLGSVSRVDAEFGHVLGVTPVAERGIYTSTGSVAADATGAIWVVFGDGTLARLDRAGRVADRTAATISPGHVAAGYGSVWVASALKGRVQRFSPLSLAEIDSSTVGSRPSAIAVGFGDVWVASAGADVVYRIDIGGGSIDASVPVGDAPAGLAVSADAVWVANSGSGTISRIDPETNQVVETIEVGHAPGGLVVAGNLLWVTIQAR
jgi:YVTN family beta-propeller protein